ncbi:hypothetical protein Syun_001390 [Stephania yunnanensis]|uniref:Uncharacterized protein n=1 Tax=Stephania yunnanensis TaxID=152371 RepID=A0AAP0LEM2_9MAGN
MIVRDESVRQSGERQAAVFIGGDEKCVKWGDFWYYANLRVTLVNQSDNCEKAIKQLSSGRRVKGQALIGGSSASLDKRLMRQMSREVWQNRGSFTSSSLSSSSSAFVFTICADVRLRRLQQRRLPPSSLSEPPSSAAASSASAFTVRAAIRLRRLQQAPPPASIICYRLRHPQQLLLPKSDVSRWGALLKVGYFACR